MEENLEAQKAILEKAREQGTEGSRAAAKPVHVSANLQDPKFTDARRRTIIGALLGSHALSSAAALAGVSMTAVNNWLRIGARHAEDDVESEYSDFWTKVRLAEAKAEHGHLTTLNRASEQGDTGTAKWLLERRFGKTWGKTDRVEIGGDGGGPVVVELTWPGQERAENRAVQAAISPPEDDEILEAELVDPDVAEG